MATDEPKAARFAPTYRSGTAARPAGIPVETLRAWERRYGVVGPRLTPRGHRLYSAEDVSRLALIKRLTDLGSPIGSIATLPLASLREMRDGAVAAVSALRARGHAVTHSPLDLAELEQLCRDAIDPEPMPARPVSPPIRLDAIPSRRFDDRSLTRIAQASTTVSCDCPRHVVDLLLSLGAFERYSAECESRNPVDAALHRHLQRVAGSARVLFEEALVLVAESRGLALSGGASVKASDSA